MPYFEVEVQVRFGREMRLRMWIASQLARLATFVMGGKANVNYSEREAS